LDALDRLVQTPKSWNKSSDVVQVKGVEKYLTTIISSPLEWIDEADREQIWNEASLRLSERSGRSGMSAFDRKFDIPSDFGSIEITIHEPALTSDNLGFKTWAASYVLARQLLSYDPASFGSGPIQALELGSGTGLVGMAAAAVWGLPVVLTDLPLIVENLARNVDSNAKVIASTGGKAVAVVLDWESPTQLQLQDDTPANFPIVLAADSIYSDQHPKLLANVVKHWLSPGSKSRFIAALPIRTGYSKELESFKAEMNQVGLVIDKEEQAIGYDDWGTDEGAVTCWISVWAWKQVAQ
jgi:predicted nicotinamide N-methyase